MRPITLLWALRSPCNLGCRYCYFGTIEEHRAAPATGPGALSHLARTDLTREQVFTFAAGLGDSAVGRVFLAGESDMPPGEWILLADPSGAATPAKIAGCDGTLLRVHRPASWHQRPALTRPWDSAPGPVASAARCSSMVPK